MGKDCTITMTEHLTVFIPQNKGRSKSYVRGFWKDERKIYYDYLEIRGVNTNNITEAVDNIREYYKQLAIFYIHDNVAYIASKWETITLSKCFEITVKDRKLLKFYVKQFLNKYKGCTVYKRGKEHTIESWTK